MNAAKNLAKGNFDTRVNLRSTGELKELEKSFNEMAARMQEGFGKLSSGMKNLTIVSSIQEILPLVLDKEGG